MSVTNRFVDAITSLIQQTQDGTISWRACSPSDDLTKGSEDVVDTVYVAEKDGRLVRLYKYRYKHFTDEDVWYWDEDVALELSDEDKSSWWRFPEHRALWDLLEAVKFKVVGVDQFIDKLLG